jgi:hypothetical protein
MEETMQILQKEFPGLAPETIELIMVVSANLEDARES